VRPSKKLPSKDAAVQLSTKNHTGMQGAKPRPAPGKEREERGRRNGGRSMRGGATFIDHIDDLELTKCV